MSAATSHALAVHVDLNGVTTPVSARRIESIAHVALRAERVRRAALSVTMLTPRAMASLNRQHLGHTGATDVITFALAPIAGDTLEGDIYICPDVARRQARAHGAGVREEVLRLVVHGVLHACGHDHPVDDTRTASAMWRRQEQLLARFLANEGAR